MKDSRRAKSGKRIAAVALLLLLLTAGFWAGTGKTETVPTESTNSEHSDKKYESAIPIAEKKRLRENTRMTAEPTEPPRETTAAPTKAPVEPKETAADSAPEPTETELPEEAPSAPADWELVRVRDYIPSVYVDLKYATQDNFTGEVIYGFTEPSLRYGTVKKLAAVQAALLKQGYSLKIWDAYRPTSAQFRLWEICPDATFVANPNTGFSSHSRGNTVDVTLVRSDGSEQEMPTGFDDFSSRADRDYSDVSAEAAENARLLEQTMASHGFRCYAAEWWHFSDVDAYSVVSE